MSLHIPVETMCVCVLGCLLVGCLDFDFLGFYGPYSIGAKSLAFGEVQKTAKHAHVHTDIQQIYMLIDGLIDGSAE